MGVVENKQLVKRIFAEQSQGNTQALLDSLADDVRWNIIGKTKFSGTYNNKQEVLDNLFGRLGPELEGVLKVTADRLIAEDDCVAIQGRGEATTNTGKSYNNTYCWFYRIVNGKVQEITEYLDTELVTEAFGR